METQELGPTTAVAHDGREHRENGQPSAHKAHSAHDEIPTDLPRIPTWGVIVAVIVLIMAFAGLFVLGWGPRQKRLAELRETTAAVEDARPLVQVALPQRSSKAKDLVLPADARAFQETSIFPRASGYLRKLHVDIGDRVKEGQLLAEIDAPDIDAELAQAKASLAQAQANLTKANNDFELSQTTLKRYQGFAQSGGVTQQQLDEKQAAFTEAQSAQAGGEANVKAADATVQRLTALQGFTKVYAPFAGTITARNYDLGALMTASSTAGRELFRIADTDTLRVFVNVPQAYVTSVRNGQSAFLSVRNYPGKEFTGTITRSTGALDPNTRTLRYEIDFANKDGTLFAGMYAQARLEVTDAQPPVVVPTSSLVFDASGTKVWVVEQGKVFPKDVNVGRDLGTDIEVSSGLKGDESVVTNPGDRLATGAEVAVAGTPAEAAPHAQPSRPQQAMAR